MSIAELENKYNDLKIDVARMTGVATTLKWCVGVMSGVFVAFLGWSLYSLPRQAASSARIRVDEYVSSADLWSLKVTRVTKADWAGNLLTKKASTSGLVIVNVSTTYGLHTAMGHIEGRVAGVKFGAVTTDDRASAGSLNVSSGSLVMPVKKGETWEVEIMDGSVVVATDDVQVLWVTSGTPSLTAE